MPTKSPAMRPETKGFLIHLAAFLAVNALLIAINLTQDPKDSWFIWPLLGWGIGIGAHGLALFLHSHEARDGILADLAVRCFIVHAYFYVGVNILLFIINIVETPDELWFIWPLAGWGIGVAIHGLLVLREHRKHEAEAAKTAPASAPKSKRAPAKRIAAKRTTKASPAKRQPTGRRPKPA